MGKQKSKKGEKRDILDTDTLQYYRRISRELQQDFDDKESKGIDDTWTTRRHANSPTLQLGPRVKCGLRNAENCRGVKCGI